MSDTRLTCPHCQTSLKLPGSIPAGRKLKCPKCTGIFAIPEPELENVARRGSEAGGEGDYEDEVRERVPRRRRVDDDYDEAEDRDERDDDVDDDYPRPRRRRRWRSRSGARSGAVTTVAVINFILGGLASACGVLAAIGGAVLGLGGAAAAANQPGMDPQGAKVAGGMLAAGGVVLTVIALIVVLWGVLAIVAGVGVIKRQQWGRILTLILAGLAAVIAVLSLLNGVRGIVGLALYGGYATTCFVTLLNRDNAAEFE